MCHLFYLKGASILALDYVCNFSVKDFLEGTDKEAEEYLVEWWKRHNHWAVYRAKIIFTWQIYIPKSICSFMLKF